MKTTTITTLAFAAIAFVFAGTSSCKKAKTKTELLSQKGWVLTSLQSKQDNDPWTDDFASYLPCEKDNIISFLASNSITTDEGAAKCNISDPQTTNDGTWAFANSEADLIVTAPASGPITFKVITLDENNLKLTGTLSGGGSTFTMEQTFTH